MRLSSASEALMPLVRRRSALERLVDIRVEGCVVAADHLGLRRAQRGKVGQQLGEEGFRSVHAASEASVYRRWRDVQLLGGIFQGLLRFFGFQLRLSYVSGLFEV